MAPTSASFIVNLKNEMEVTKNKRESLIIPFKPAVSMVKQDFFDKRSSVLSNSSSVWSKYETDGGTSTSISPLSPLSGGAQQGAGVMRSNMFKGITTIAVPSGYDVGSVSPHFVEVPASMEESDEFSISTHSGGYSYNEGENIDVSFDQANVKVVGEEPFPLSILAGGNNYHFNDGSMMNSDSIAVSQGLHMNNQVEIHTFNPNPFHSNSTQNFNNQGKLETGVTGSEMTMNYKQEDYLKQTPMIETNPMGLPVNIIASPVSTDPNEFYQDEFSLNEEMRREDGNGLSSKQKTITMIVILLVLMMLVAGVLLWRFPSASSATAAPAGVTTGS